MIWFEKIFNLRKSCQSGTLILYLPQYSNNHQILLLNRENYQFFPKNVILSLIFRSYLKISFDSKYQVEQITAQLLRYRYGAYHEVISRGLLNLVFQTFVFRIKHYISRT